MSAISLPDPTVVRELAAPVVSSYGARVDARPGAVRAALDQLEPLPRLARALRALCAGEGSVRRTSSPMLRDERSFALELCLGEDSATVTLTWVVTLAARGARATGVSIVSRVEAERACEMDRVLDAWVIVGPMVDDQTCRIARALKDAAEQDDLEGA